MLKLAVPAWTVLALTLAAPSAWAQCATVDPVIVPQIRVDPLAASEATDLIQPLQLTFRRSGIGSEPVKLRYQIIDDDSAAIARVGLSQGPVIDWTSADSSRSIGALRYEAYSLLRTGVVTIGADDGAVQRAVTLRLGDVRSDIPAGVYREQFTVRYWCEAEEMGLPYESAGAIAVSVAVPNVLSASVAGASLRGEIDFMDFAALSRTLQVSVRSTGPYRVSARSENNSVLIREGGEASLRASDRISYSADFAGEGLSLVNAADARQMPRAGLAGRLIPLVVNVDSIKGKVAGRYFDTIYLTLEPAN